MTKCGRLLFTCAIYHRQGAGESRGSTRGRKRKMTGNENGSTGRINLLSNTRWVNDAIRLRTPHSHALASVGPSLNRELIAPMKFSQEAMYFPLGFPLRILDRKSVV